MQQGAQRPAGAIAGQHVEVVDVQGALAVGLAQSGRIDMLKPVVGDHFARHVEDQPAQRIALVGVGIDPPVLARQVFIDRGFHVDQRLAVFAQFLVGLAIDDVGARGREVIGGDQACSTTSWISRCAGRGHGSDGPEP